MTVIYRENSLIKTSYRDCTTKIERIKFQSDIVKAGRLILSIKN